MTVLNGNFRETDRAKPRSGAIDAVRLLGIVAIVAGHAWTRDATATVFYTWHVPVFFFLSGYLWSGRRTISGELRNKWETLGKPYTFWLAVLAAMTLGVLTVTRDNPIDRILGALYGGAAAIQPFTTFWFVSVLLVATVLYKGVSKLPLWGQWVFAAAGIFTGAIIGPALASTPLSIGSAFPCMAYLIAGVSLKRVRPAIKMPLITGLTLLALSAAVVAMGWSAPMDIKFGDYGTPGSSFAVACAISFGLVLIMDALFANASKASAVVTRFAMAGFAIVLIHPVFLWSPTPQIIDFFAGLLIPLAIGLVALRTRLSSWATGKPRQN